MMTLISNGDDNGMTVLYIGLAGIAGALARYGLSIAMNPHQVTSLPWGTLLCNLAGCLTLGFLAYLPGLKRYPSLRAALTTGFVGAFTTFSTLSWELVSMLQQQLWTIAAIYFIVSLWGGIGCIRLGRRFGLNLTAVKRGSEE